MNMINPKTNQPTITSEDKTDFENWGNRFQLLDELEPAPEESKDADK